MSHLLVVEDDDTIGAILTKSLQRQGYDVTWTRAGQAAVAAASRSVFDLALLDLGLPDIDGVEVCRRLRDRQPSCVLVMLTARRDEMDVVVGLEAGADDYLTKPFRWTELLARVRAHLRRGPVADSATPVLTLGDLTLDRAARRCTVGGHEVQLRPREFDLLARLAAEPGVAVGRDRLIADVWDEHWFGSTKTLDVHVAAVRRRLADAVAERPLRTPTIVTLRGFGYRLDGPSDP